MSSPIEAKRYSIEYTIQNRKRKRIYYSIIILFMLSLPYINDILLHIKWLDSITVIVFMLGIIIFGLFLSNILEVSTNEEKAFLHLYKTHEILEQAINNEDLRKPAYEEFMRAIEKIEAISVGDAPWYSQAISDEKKFTENLRTRVAPAILEGKVNAIEALFYMNLFLNQTTEGMRELTEKIQQRFPEREQKENNLTTQINNAISTKIGRLGFSLVSGYGLFIFIVLIYTKLTNQIFSEITRSNPNVILIGGITLTGLIFTGLKKE